MDDMLVLNLIKLCGPLTHKQLMNKLDCGFFAIDEVLRRLCKAGHLHHQILFTRRGYKNEHLFMVLK